MTDIRIEAGTLHATEDPRIKRGLLLPFNEKISARNNTGKIFSIDKGVVTLPRDPEIVTVNNSHVREEPLGRVIALDETDAGIEASIRFANTPEGDALLAELTDPDAPKARRKLSAEVADLVIEGGKAVSGRLFGAAVCVAGAFAGATLYAAEVDDLEGLADDIQGFAPEATPEQINAAVEAVVNEVSTDDSTPNNESETVEENTLTASAPAGLGGAHTAPRNTSASAFFTQVADANNHAKRGDRSGFFALSDIIPADVLGTERPQYEGELWSGNPYERQIVGLFNNAGLTSFTVSGYEWVTKPKVGRYAGNKTAVPSNSVETRPVSIEAIRLAGAHDIDRKFRDFNDNSFFESYYRAMTESYAIESDAYVIEVISSVAPEVTGVVAPAGVSRLMAGVTRGSRVIRQGTRSNATFALAAEDIYEEFMLTRQDDVLPFLNSSLNISGNSATGAGFTILPSADLEDGQVLVGARSAATVHELGGGAPIRVEALDVANGGVDAGVFGYLAVNVHDAKGLALVTVA